MLALPGMLLAMAACGSPSGSSDTESPSGEAGGTETATATTPAELAGAAEGWNVLLLSVDTLRADRLNAYGYGERTTSPALDELFAGGVRFQQASAPRSITWPSLASVLTGLYPSGHGVFENGYELPEDLPTLPLRLDAAGYQTAAFLSNMCRAGHRGWDALRCSQGRDGRTLQWALEWSDTLDREQPFFLWVHYFGAHSPYYNGGDLAARELDPDYQGDLIPKKWRLDRVMEEKEELDAADRRHLDAIYDAAVIGSDGLSGRLLAGLRERGLLERTLVVFLSDHGEDLYQHNGYLYHACSVYQSSLHVPLGFVAPGLIPADSAVSQPVELTDVAPTILDLLGLPPIEEAHGLSLRPYLERPQRGGAGKPAYTEYGDTRIHTVLSGDWKLVVNPDKLTPFCFGGGPADLYPIEALELYNLAEDPFEQENLSTQHPARVAELQTLIRQRFAGLAQRTERQDIPEELKEELRSLGYVAN